MLNIFSQKCSKRNYIYSIRGTVICELYLYIKNFTVNSTLNVKFNLFNHTKTKIF